MVDASQATYEISAMRLENDRLVTQVHVFYEEAPGHLYRRIAGSYPLALGSTLIDEEYNSENGWLVCLVPNATELSTLIPHERRAICIHEPSVMNCLPASYLNQFGLLISPHRISGFKGHWFESHSGLPWFFGARLNGAQLLPTMSLNDLKTLKPPQKSNSVSVVVSRKVFHKGHRKRLRLLEMLQDQIGDRLLIYGRGIREIEDKAEAILPSELHLSLENTVERSYWTEKLSDALLGFALPVYGGCPNIHDWFPSDSMLTINPDDPEDACQIIRNALDNNLYQRRLSAIIEARHRILHNESAFHVVERAIVAHPSFAPNLVNTASIQPPGKGNFGDRLQREARRVFQQMTFRSRLWK